MVADFVRCTGCELKEQLEDQMHKQKVKPKGVHVHLVPNPNPQVRRKVEANARAYLIGGGD